MTAPAKVWQYRTLITNLALRDLRSRYKKSVLGWLWSLINPAVTLGIYTVVFGYFLKGTAPALGKYAAGTTDEAGGNFALYLFSALVVWNAFSGGINQSIGSFLAAGPMLTRTYFPPECPIFAGSLTVLTQTTLESLILLVFMAVVGNVGWTFIFVIPIVVLLATFAFGLGLFAALLNVRYRDINYLVNIGLQLAFYATPIVYRLDKIGNGSQVFVKLIKLNPMTHFVAAMRNSTYLLKPPSLANWGAMVLAATFTVTVAWAVFSRKAPRFIEEI